MTIEPTTDLNTRIHILVPAAGSGQRFGGPVPKQYTTLCGKPVIERSLQRLLELARQLSVEHIHVAVSADDDIWQQLEISKNPAIRTVLGGQTRAESVQNALKNISEANSDDWILIHDAVRPLVEISDICKLIQELSGQTAGGLLAAPIHETVKRASINKDVIATEDRNGLWLAQTPQMFRYGCLVEALGQSGSSETITDEASAVEAAGYRIKLVEGSRTNIKITRPDDLKFAEIILAHSSEAEK